MTKSDTRPYRAGVGAVVFGLDGRVLVARRADTPIEAWQLPQGGVKAGEAPIQALMRELREEIGTNDVDVLDEVGTPLRYDLPMELAARVWGGKYRGQEQHWFAVLFRGNDTDIDLSADRKPEFDAWRWADLSELPDLAVGFKRAVYEHLVCAFTATANTLAGAGSTAIPSDVEGRTAS